MKARICARMAGVLLTAVLAVCLGARQAGAQGPGMNEDSLSPSEAMELIEDSPPLKGGDRAGPAAGRREDGAGPWMRQARQGEDQRRRLREWSERYTAATNADERARLTEELKAVLQDSAGRRTAFRRRIAEHAGHGEFASEGARGGVDRDLERRAALYRAEADPQKKEELMAGLKTTIEKAFDERMADQWERFDQAQAKVARLGERLTERQQNKEQICEMRLRQLLTDPGLRW